MREYQPKRREVFQGLIALSAIGGLAACGDEGASSDPTLGNAVYPGYFTGTEMSLISALAQTIIPRTETAGAVQAGVPETLQDLATEWGDAEFQQYWRDGLARLATVLVSDTGQSFVSLSPIERVGVLGAYDASVFGEDADDQFYRDFKATLVRAYYMSEPGATEELAYEAVPGEWIGCVSLSDFPKAWAT